MSPICGPATADIHRESDGTRWCFVCRAPTEFEYVVTATVEPSYYDPTSSIQCPHGHIDGDLFPGRTRELDAWTDTSTGRDTA